MLKESRDHLDEVNEGYVEHFGAALRISLQLAKASVACAVHALVPAFCTRTASRSVIEVHADMVRRGAVRPFASR